MHFPCTFPHSGEVSSLSSPLLLIAYFSMKSGSKRQSPHFEPPIYFADSMRSLDCYNSWEATETKLSTVQNIKKPKIIPILIHSLWLKTAFFIIQDDYYYFFYFKYSTATAGGTILVVKWPITRNTAGRRDEPYQCLILVQTQIEIAGRPHWMLLTFLKSI